ncbi:MAG: hypothetical protein ACK44D_13435, partial [Bacteroidia bacterium]
KPIISPKRIKTHFFWRKLAYNKNYLYFRTPKKYCHGIYKIQKKRKKEQNCVEITHTDIKA